MSTRRQRRAARRNGKKSQGPVTPEGKARSAANAFRHGLTARCTNRLADTIVLTIENREEFNALYQIFVGEHRPTTEGEHLIIEEMTVARWKLQRAWLMETSVIEDEMDQMTGELETKYETMDNGTRLGLAFRGLAEKSPSLQLLQRYTNSLTRQLDRCVKRLENLRRSKAANSTQIRELVNEQFEPNPNIEHQEITAKSVESTRPDAGEPAQTAAGQRQPAIPAHPGPSQVGVLHNGPEPVDPDALPGAPGTLPRAA